MTATATKRKPEQTETTLDAVRPLAEHERYAAEHAKLVKVESEASEANKLLISTQREQRHAQDLHTAATRYLDGAAGGVTVESLRDLQHRAELLNKAVVVQRQRLDKIAGEITSEVERGLRPAHQACLQAIGRAGKDLLASLDAARAFRVELAKKGYTAANLPALEESPNLLRAAHMARTTLELAELWPRS